MLFLTKKTTTTGWNLCHILSSQLLPVTLAFLIAISTLTKVDVVYISVSLHRKGATHKWLSIWYGGMGGYKKQWTSFMNVRPKRNRTLQILFKNDDVAAQCKLSKVDFINTPNWMIQFRIPLVARNMIQLGDFSICIHNLWFINSPVWPCGEIFNLSFPKVQGGNLFFFLQVAAMMSCPLSMPLTLLPPDLHADYPPVHIGIKVCVMPLNYNDWYF